ncbi:SatD family protein [Janibacter sp. GS2]|uniref:SatD family protein n=1 Tax=Janibacter sp. GS2 TaxID=3442646 RepID=UPI003EBB2066
MSAGAAATFIGDVVGSRRADDRQSVHDALVAGLTGSARLEGVIDPGRVTVGDEFQGSFATLGQALTATLHLRLTLLPEVDVRIGLGWGGVSTLDADTRDGPGWWAAREAIDWVKDTQTKGVTTHVRSAYRRAPAGDGADPRGSLGPDPGAVNAALLCRDQLLGELDARDLRLLRGLLAGRSQRELADQEKVSPSAISQRVRFGGIGVLILADEQLATVGSAR